MKSFFFLFALISLLVCSHDAASTGKMRVNSYQQTCFGFIPQECLQIQWDNDIGSDTWSNFYDPIEGFDYEEGYIYDLVVESMDRPGPPIMDASNTIYRLISLDRKIKGNLALNINRDECSYRYPGSIQLEKGINIDNTKIDVKQYMEIEFWFKLNSECTAIWCNILHVGDKNLAARLPGIWINGRNKVFMFVMGNDEEGENPRSDVWNPPFDITLDGVEHLFYLKFNDEQKIVMIDGIPYYREIMGNYPNTNFQGSYPLYLSDPWHPAADMTLRDICIYSNTELSKTIQSEHVCLTADDPDYSYLNGEYTQYPQKAKDTNILFYFKKNLRNGCQGDAAKQYYIWNWNDDNPQWAITSMIGEYDVATCDVSGAPTINSLFECNGNWNNKQTFTITNGECPFELLTHCIGDDTNIFSNIFTNNNSQSSISILILISSIFILITIISCYCIGYKNGTKTHQYSEINKIEKV